MSYFVFCIHNHQPVGNFDQVMDDAYQRSYEPFLRHVFEYPDFKLTLHTSGFLLDWLERTKPAYIELLREMVRRGQVEILGGGFYEPVLSVLPMADRVGQIKKLSDKIEKLFGVTPKGVWLAERVWDPSIPTTLKAAGMEYVVVDDYHFIKSGLRVEDLAGYYVTEELGECIKVVPGSERLRYLIPFNEVGGFKDHMEWVERNYRDGISRGRTGIFADDGEKFGVWPGTEKWVYEEGWLKSFLECAGDATGGAAGDVAKDSPGGITPITISELIELEEPLGSVYLPTTSYMEMGEWALPPEASREYSELREELKGRAEYKRIERFLQGGAWRNFFAKYPESNWMHKRMLMVSEAVSKAADEGLKGSDLDEAVENLYKSQCNDAYWHGVFGGLYLPHLREKVYSSLLRAEAILAKSDGNAGETKLKAVISDIDCDGFDELQLRAGDLGLFISPRRGGTLVELDYYPLAVNLLNVLSKWNEGYHKKLEGAADEGGASGGSTKSIHDMVVTKEEGLEKYLNFDTLRRASLRDRFFSTDTTLESIVTGGYDELGDFLDSSYEPTLVEGGVVLARDGTVSGSSVRVEKKLILAGPGVVDIRYKVKAVSEAPTAIADDILFGVEFNLCLPCCSGPACYYEIGGERSGLGASAVSSGLRSFRVADSYTGGLTLDFELSEDATLWRYPIESVSLSEAGFERNYQGSTVIFSLPFDGSSELDFTIKLKISKA